MRSSTILIERTPVACKHIKSKYQWWIIRKRDILETRYLLGFIVKLKRQLFFFKKIKGIPKMPNSKCIYMKKIHKFGLPIFKAFLSLVFCIYYIKYFPSILYLRLSFHWYLRYFVYIISKLFNSSDKRWPASLSHSL